MNEYSRARNENDGGPGFQGFKLKGRKKEKARPPPPRGGGGRGRPVSEHLGSSDGDPALEPFPFSVGVSTLPVRALQWNQNFTTTFRLLMRAENRINVLPLFIGRHVVFVARVGVV